MRSVVTGSCGTLTCTSHRAFRPGGKRMHHHEVRSPLEFSIRRTAPPPTATGLSMPPLASSISPASPGPAQMNNDFSLGTRSCAPRSHTRREAAPGKGALRSRMSHCKRGCLRTPAAAAVTLSACAAPNSAPDSAPDSVSGFDTPFPLTRSGGAARLELDTEWPAPARVHGRTVPKLGNDLTCYVMESLAKFRHRSSVNTPAPPRLVRRPLPFRSALRTNLTPVTDSESESVCGNRFRFGFRTQNLIENCPTAQGEQQGGGGEQQGRGRERERERECFIQECTKRETEHLCIRPPIHGIGGGPR